MPTDRPEPADPAVAVAWEALVALSHAMQASDPIAWTDDELDTAGSVLSDFLAAVAGERAARMGIQVVVVLDRMTEHQPDVHVIDPNNN